MTDVDRPGALDERLRRLADATEGLRAPHGFAAAVMERIASRERTARALWRTGRIAVAGFAAAAALAAVLSVQAQDAAADGLLASFDPIEIEP